MAQLSSYQIFVPWRFTQGRLTTDGDRRKGTNSRTVWKIAYQALSVSPIQALLLKTAVGECLIADVLIDSDRYRQSACGKMTALTFIQGPSTEFVSIPFIQRPMQSSVPLS